jgi:3-hydroxyisobutyrate dehydrogenase-like beta-hydroxyacid dehydrogenase
MQKIAYLGIGIMGRGMAGNLLKAGTATGGIDRSAYTSSVAKDKKPQPSASGARAT